MTDEANNRPTHSAYAVRNFDRDGKQDSSWLRVRAAWQHKDGKIFDVVLEGGKVFRACDQHIGKELVREVNNTHLRPLCQSKVYLL